MTIQLDGSVVSTTMRTPGHDFELAAGFCFTEGLLAGAPVTGVRYCANGAAAATATFNVVTVETGGLAPAPTPRLGPTSSSCGWCGSDQIDDLLDRLAPLPPSTPIDADRAGRMPARVLGGQGLFARPARCTPRPPSTATARCSLTREDVGRHNAVDKVVGALLLDGRAAGDRPRPVRQRAGVGRDGAEGMGGRVRHARRSERADGARRPRRPPGRARRSSGSSAATLQPCTRRDGSSQPDAMRTEIGLGVLHLFCKPAATVDREAVGAALKAVEAAEGQVVTAAMLGHKCDLAVMALHPTGGAAPRCRPGCRRPGSTSSTATSASPRSASTPRACPSTCCSDRLYPPLPPDGKPVFCFYPMTKRREAHANWFATPYDERDAMMREHGKSGRTFAGRVVQLITGSTGLDDFEWGVTLFAITPEVVKDVVYTMRFDKGSALYGEFGRFYVGYLSSVDDVLDGGPLSDGAGHGGRAGRAWTRRSPAGRRTRTRRSGPASGRRRAELDRAARPLVVDVAVVGQQRDALANSRQLTARR